MAMLSLTSLMPGGFSKTSLTSLWLTLMELSRIPPPPPPPPRFAGDVTEETGVTGGGVVTGEGVVVVVVFFTVPSCLSSE